MYFKELTQPITNHHIAGYKDVITLNHHTVNTKPSLVPVLKLLSLQTKDLTLNNGLCEEVNFPGSTYWSHNTVWFLQNDCRNLRVHGSGGFGGFVESEAEAH